ncbi:MAG: hypothetical protein R3E13_03650 [Alphaproteobacteria bacterium]
MMKTSPLLFKGLLLLSTVLIAPHGLAHAAPSGDSPSLVITSDPLPEHLRKQIYSKPVKVRSIKPAEVISRDYYHPAQTLVGDKVAHIRDELSRIQNEVGSLSGSLNGMERLNEERAAEYYANIATINTQLQSGTTPGNPRLVRRLDEAGAHLETLSESVAQLNGVAVEASNVASEASFLLEEARAAYSLSGAIEEDHVNLAQVEDAINSTIILIQRVLNTVNDDVTRTSTYLSSERENLRILALAVANGDFYGRSLTDRPFSSAPLYASAPSAASSAPPQTTGSPALSGPRPLAKIRFDRPDVNYEEPVYLAVNEALKRYPDARFDLVAVTPTQGNAAEVAIESTKARRNAEKVLRTLTQMGLPQDRVDLSYSESGQSTSNEVHLFVK